MSALTRNDTLRYHHLHELIDRRGLSLPWCEANCRSVTAATASELLGYKAHSDGIWLEGENMEGQYKPDTPWKGTGEKKAPKYRTALGDYDAILPRHPENPRFWADTEALKSACYIINGRPFIIITEGFFKALYGCAISLPTVSLMGIEMGLTPKEKDPQGKRYLVPTLERLSRAGFGFIHAFDADCATNPAVITATRKLCHQIASFSVPQYIATGLWSVDEGKGMDDYIQKNGEEAFRRQVLAKAVPFEAWEAQFRSSSGRDDEKLSQQSLSVRLIDKYREILAWHVPNKAWYMYEHPAEGKVIPGVWAEVSDEVVGYLVTTEAAQRLSHFNHDLVAGAIRFMKYQLRVDHWKTMPGFVCMKDCVLEVSTLTVHPHAPGYRFLSALPYSWRDRSVGCEPVKEWLLEICEGRREFVEVIRAAMNATVTEKAGRLQRFMELLGFGGTGKGSIIRLVTSLVGRENVAVTDLKQLEKNRFETASLYGKKAVIITDSERYAGDVAILKALTGQDLLRYEKKGVQQTKGYRFDGMVWIAANEAIQSADYTSGLKRRRLSMPFNRVVPPHMRRDLESEFEPFLPGVLSWVLSMPSGDVIDYLQNTDAKAPSLRGFQADILLETNPIALWADTALVLSPGRKTFVGNKGMDASQYLFANYSAWAESAGYNPVSQARFSRNLLDLLKSQLGVSDVDKGRGNKGSYIEGITIRLPGMDSWPRLITGDGFLENSDASVTGQVTGESLTEKGIEESDGFLSREVPENSSATDPPSNIESSETNLEISGEIPQNPSLEPIPAVTKPVTGDGSPVKNPSLLLLESMKAAWNDRFRLGELVLAACEEELQAVAASLSTEEISYLQEAARSAWKPGFNRDVVYQGERVEVWKAGQGRSVTVKTKGGSYLSVKCGDLAPWLGI